MYNTAGDKDIGGTHLYTVICCEYEIEVRKPGGDIIQTKRHGLFCCLSYKSTYNFKEIGEEKMSYRLYSM